MRIIIVLVFVVFLFSSYVAAEEMPTKDELKRLLGEAYSATKDYESAIEQYNELLEKDPRNVEARVSLADTLSWNKKYKEAITEYKKALKIEPDNLLIKQKLADVLSWDKKYSASLRLYNEILRQKDDPKMRLQKARILGWRRDYGGAVKEYRRILEKTPDELIELELDAKIAYWNGRVKRAIRLYEELIRRDPENVEAMFDLSQVYSYQAMWEEAGEEYSRILDLYPGHTRAMEAQEKAELISRHMLFNSGYEFFDGESQERQSDIRKSSSFMRLSAPVTPKFGIEGEHYLTYRNFSDFQDVLENRDKVTFSYVNNPSWWIEAFYAIYNYNRHIRNMHNFGGKANVRLFDVGTAEFFYQRERLENNSLVIRERYYQDSFKERITFDINKYLKVGLDYTLSYYSDDNYKNEPGFDVLYYLSLEPMKFSVKYRYLFRDFDKNVNHYFSPRNFTANKITFNWRHFLNKDEIFFGADDLYYDVKYDLTIDSLDVISQKVSGELNWDVNKRLNLNVRASLTESTDDVYTDRSLIAGVKYYF